MKNWIKLALYGALVGLIIGIIHFIFPNYALFRLSLPLSFIYTPLIKLLLKQFTLIQSMSIFYLIALIIEGFIIGAIISLLKRVIKNPTKDQKQKNKRVKKSKTKKGKRK